MCGRFGQRRRLDDRSSCEVVIEDSLSVGFEDGFSGHCEGCEVCLLFDLNQHEIFSMGLFC